MNDRSVWNNSYCLDIDSVLFHKFHSTNELYLFYFSFVFHFCWRQYLFLAIFLNRLIHTILAWRSNAFAKILIMLIQYIFSCVFGIYHFQHFMYIETKLKSYIIHVKFIWIAFESNAEPCFCTVLSSFHGTKSSMIETMVMVLFLWTQLLFKTIFLIWVHVHCLRRSYSQLTWLLLIYN